MTKTLLIIIGLLAAVLAAAGIMWYDKSSPEIMAARRQLYDKNPSVRCEAIYSIGDIGDKKFIPEIIKLLHDKDSGVRSSAVFALLKLDPKKSIPEIIKLAQDKDPDVRLLIVQILPNHDAKEAIPEIKKLLKDEYELIRKTAEKALKYFGVPEAEIEQAKQK